MSAKETPTHILVRDLFSNPKGEELLARWQIEYGDRVSHSMDISGRHAGYMEGERGFFLTIKYFVNTDVEQIDKSLNQKRTT